MHCSFICIGSDAGVCGALAGERRSQALKVLAVGCTSKAQAAVMVKALSQEAVHPHELANRTTRGKGGVNIGAAHTCGYTPGDGHVDCAQ